MEERAPRTHQKFISNLVGRKKQNILTRIENKNFETLLRNNDIEFMELFFRDGAEQCHKICVIRHIFKTLNFDDGCA